MPANDRYQIGTPEMIRKDRDRAKSTHAALHSKSAETIVWTFLALSFGVILFFWYLTIKDHKDQIRQDRVIFEQALVDLESACARKAGSLVKVEGGHLCLSNATILFGVEDVMSEKAREITGASAASE
jgi:hypothetical protein